MSLPVQAMLFAQGSATVAAAGPLSVTAGPSRSASKAPRRALRHHESLHVTATLTFTPSAGGSPLTETQTVGDSLPRHKTRHEK